MSHGQAIMERDFSINKDTSTNGRMLIVDVMNQLDEITRLTVTKVLLIFAPKKY